MGVTRFLINSKLGVLRARETPKIIGELAWKHVIVVRSGIPGILVDLHGLCSADLWLLLKSAQCLQNIIMG